ncbi:zinc finger protein 691-like [Sitophilus oryzae]|uniref:Zinc finger protein 691-like n=1 Tax=Sitophilus oryzae TaxID=7048 RepID=A0A6J2YXD2_SITOR|nr:zinc finger protein 691-like [Sitophilus oryzae]
MAQCAECKLNFSNKSNLKVHVKRIHPDKLDQLCPRKRKPFGSGAVECKECGNKFTRHGNLRSHIKQKHSDKCEELLARSNTKEFILCEECGNQLHSLGLLKKHKESHKIKTIIQIKCLLCNYVGGSRDILIAHYNNVHNFKIENETHEFDSFEAFQSWKSKMESETFSSFIHKRTNRKNQAAVKIEYYCHRSGYFKARGANIRHLKTQGSNKINGYCPANVKVVLKNGRYFANYCKTHVGHKLEEDVSHIFLMKTERDQIATIIIGSNVPLQITLNEIHFKDVSIEQKR